MTKESSMTRYDLVVLGSGPAGRRAAIQASKLGRSVLVVDDRAQIGGVSVHTGTVPSKTLRETALNLSGWRERGFYGQAYRVKRDIRAEDLTARISTTLKHEVDVLELQFARNGVRVAKGVGRFADPHRITITHSENGSTSEETVYGEHILIAVGTAPYRPDTVAFDDRHILDSDAFIRTPRLPRSLAVVGAGVIGIEYATIMSALDIPVTIIEPRDTILDFIDSEITDYLLHQLRDRGISVRLGVSVESVKLEKGVVRATTSDGRVIASDMLLYAAGRIGATSDLGLEHCGLAADARGKLRVDVKTMQTPVPHIYAAGDVIGFPSLASTSMEQGRIAACHAFGAPLPKGSEMFPFGIYAVPEISSVGMTEAAATAAGIQYEVGVARLRETSRGHIMGVGGGLLKMIFSLADRRLLGVHIIGEGATELIHIGQAVANLGGTLDYFIEHTFNYPTLAEAYKIAALDAWNRMPAKVREAAPVTRLRKAA
jgi:NAD(P) transhydrogenase